MRSILGFVMLLVISTPAFAALEGISNTDAVGGLRQALNDGSLAAVAKLGVENGYFANPRVKIPLPPALQRIEGALRLAGMRKQADDLVLSMNRAAEAAAAQAKPLLVDAVGRYSPEATLRAPSISSVRLNRSSPSATCRSSSKPPIASGSRSSTTRSPGRACIWASYSRTRQRSKVTLPRRRSMVSIS